MFWEFFNFYQDEPYWTVGMKRDGKTYYMADHTPHINHCLWSVYIGDAFPMGEEDALFTMDDLNQHGRETYCTKHEPPDTSFIGLL